MTSVLAFDLGASSGRALIGTLQGRRLVVEEIHRFANEPVLIGNRLHWDILRLFHHIKQGIIKAKHLGYMPASIGIDSWAVDYGLLDSSGELLGNPYHYRDTRTDGVMEQVLTLLPREEIFQHTGIQFLPFNTLYQLVAQKKQNPERLAQAKHLLMIPDLLRYFLTGEIKSEFTNATTTQLYNPALGDWDPHLLTKLGLPRNLFAEIVQPGTIIGQLQASICAELEVPSVPVIAVAEHDTGSAVAAIPADDDDFAYLICGTWSLLGTEIRDALTHEQALQENFTNEGGVDGTYRLLKNIMGLWIVQECRSHWEKRGVTLSFEQMVQEASSASGFVSFIDPDHLMFLHPSDMPALVQAYCSQTGQPVPQERGEILRCVFESLALKYRYVYERTEALSGKHFSGLHMAGGGIHNRLLCQFTANALSRPVWAGPSEASAIGNILVQYRTLGQISGIGEARQIVRESFSLETYVPEEQEQWSKAYERFLHMTGLGNR